MSFRSLEARIQEVCMCVFVGVCVDSMECRRGQSLFDPLVVVVFVFLFCLYVCLFVCLSVCRSSSRLVTVVTGLKECVWGVRVVGWSNGGGLLSVFPCSSQLHGNKPHPAEPGGGVNA